MPHVSLALSASIPEARIAQISRDLPCSGVTASLVGAPSTPGDKGDPGTLGQIALALTTTKPMTTLIECLKAYLTHRPSR